MARVLLIDKETEKDFSHAKANISRTLLYLDQHVLGEVRRIVGGTDNMKIDIGVMLELSRNLLADLEMLHNCIVREEPDTESYERYEKNKLLIDKIVEGR